jgi:hypothetical protein
MIHNIQDLDKAVVLLEDIAELIGIDGFAQRPNLRMEYLQKVSKLIEIFDSEIEEVEAKKRLYGSSPNIRKKLRTLHRRRNYALLLLR